MKKSGYAVGLIAGLALAGLAAFVAGAHGDEGTGQTARATHRHKRRHRHSSRSLASVDEAPFPACKGIPITAAKPSTNCVNCQTAEREAQIHWYTTGLDSISDVQVKAQMVAFLEAVGSQYHDNLEKNLATLRQQRTCYSKGHESDPSCLGIFQDMNRTIATVSPKIEMEIALATSKNDTIRGELGYQTDSEKKGEVNSDLRDPWISAWWQNNPFSGLTLTSSQLSDAQTEARKETAAIQAKVHAEVTANNAKAAQDPASYSEYGLVSGTAVESEGAFFQQAYRANQLQHRANIRSLILGNAPIFYYLTPAKSRDAKGNPVFAPDQIEAAIDKLIANAKDQETENDRILDPHQYNSKDPLLPSDPVASMAKALQTYLAYGPLVESVLKQHPEFCGAAASVSKLVRVEQFQDMAAVMAGLTVASGGAAAIAPAVTGLTASTAGAWIGFGMGVGFTASAAENVNSVAEALGTYSGAEVASGRESGPNMDPSAMNAAVQNFKLQVALNGALTVVGGPAGSMILKAGEKSLLGADIQAQISTLSAGSTTAEQAAVSKAMIERVLGSSNQQVTLNTLNDFTKRAFNTTDPKALAALSDQEAQNWLTAVKAMGLSSAKSAQEVKAAQAVAKIMANVDPTTMGWRPDSFEGFSRMMTQLRADLAQKSPDEIDAILADPAKQTQQIKTALRELGVSDGKADEMSVCAFRN